MRRFLFLLPLALGLVSCDSGSDPVAAAAEEVATNPVSIKVGDVWSYRGVRWWSEDGAAMERVRVFTQCTAVKDTTIEGIPFVLIDQVQTKIDKDSIRTATQRNAIHVDDTSVVVWDNQELAYGGGVLPAGRAAAVPVDSLLKSDAFVMPLRFPLKAGQSRSYAGTGVDVLTMRYVGRESVTVPGGTVSALRLERENRWDVASKSTLWIGPKGLVRRISSDSTMSGAGLYVMRDTTAWLGNLPVPTDSLVVR